MSLFKKEKKELIVLEKKEIIPPVTEQTVTDYMKAFGLAGNLMDHEVEAFKQMATLHNLNPFNREIYCVAYREGDKRKLSILTGYEVYIRKAEQSGLLEYWVVDDASPETPIEQYWVKVIIKRKDKAREQAWTVFYSEGVQKDRYGKVNSFWAKQPRMMTKKVAMSQGFRLFFEDVMHGIPYTREEMPEEKGGMTDVTPKAIDKSEPRKEPPQPKAKNIKKEYEEEKEKIIEESYNRSDPELPKNPKDKAQPQESNTGTELKDIVKMINEAGDTIPNKDKGGIILSARNCQGNSISLGELKDELQREYGI